MIFPGLNQEFPDNGEPRAGRQIPAGQYRVCPAESAIFACYSIYDGPIGTRSQLEEFVMVHEETAVSLAEGQYIVISDCEMRLAEEEADG